MPFSTRYFDGIDVNLHDLEFVSPIHHMNSMNPINTMYPPNNIPPPWGVPMPYNTSSYININSFRNNNNNYPPNIPTSPTPNISSVPKMTTIETLPTIQSPTIAPVIQQSSISSLSDGEDVEFDTANTRNISMDSKEQSKKTSRKRSATVKDEIDEEEDEEFKRIRAHRMADSKRRAKLSSLFHKLHQVTHDEEVANESETSKPKQGAILQNAIDEIERLKSKLNDYEQKLDSATKHSARISSLINTLHQEANGGVYSIAPEMSSFAYPSAAPPSTSTQLVKAKANGPRHFEVQYNKRYRRRNGDIIHAFVRTTLIPDANGYVEMIISRVTPTQLYPSRESNNTRNKDAAIPNGEGFLIASCEGLHLAIHLIPALIGTASFQKGVDLKLRYMNNFLCDMLGLQPQECFTLTLGQISHPDDTLEVFRALSKTQLCSNSTKT
jgi:hypothetical protein